VPIKWIFTPRKILNILDEKRLVTLINGYGNDFNERFYNFKRRIKPEDGYKIIKTK